jgi:hypothetical protein
LNIGQFSWYNRADGSVTLQGRQIACPAQAQQGPVTDAAIVKPLPITACS